VAALAQVAASQRLEAPVIAAALAAAM